MFAASAIAHAALSSAASARGSAASGPPRTAKAFEMSTEPNRPERSAISGSTASPAIR